MTRLAAYTREAPAGDSNSSSAGEEEEEEEGGWGEEAEAAGPDAAGAALEDLQLSAAGGRAAQARKGAVPAMESPDSAVRRIAAQRHAAMLERSARTGRARAFE